VRHGYGLAINLGELSNISRRLVMRLPGVFAVEEQMTTSFYDRGDADLPPVEELRERLTTDAGSEYGNFRGSAMLSQRSRLESNFTCVSPDASDDDLITRAQCGDQQAFVELSGRHSSLLKNKIFKIVRNQEDAEDAIQDTLLQAYTHITSFRRSCKFSSWLVTIGVNSALMIMRKRKIRREACAGAGSEDMGPLEIHEPVDRSMGPEGIYLKQQAILLVRREVERLHPSLRSVVNHYYGSECSLQEAAKALDISLHAAKSRLYRGRRRLRSSLARYEGSKFRN
jgi:RNA polymerase sigma-70 factor (ECF subfamily)